AMHRPEQQQQVGCSRLAEGGDVNVEGAERHAVGAELGAGALIERLDFICHDMAAKYAERLDEPKCQTAGKPGEIGGFAQPKEGAEPRVELGGQPSLDAPQDLLAFAWTKMLVGKNLNLRFERTVATLQPRNFRLTPSDAAIGLQHDCLITSRGERCGAVAKLVRQNFEGGVPRGAAMNAVAAGVGREAKAVEVTDIVILDQDAAIRTDFR